MTLHLCGIKERQRQTVLLLVENCIWTSGFSSSWGWRESVQNPVQSSLPQQIHTDISLSTNTRGKYTNKGKAMTWLYLEAMFSQCRIIQLSNLYFLNWMAFNNWTLYLKTIKLNGSGGSEQVYISQSLAWISTVWVSEPKLVFGFWLYMNSWLHLLNPRLRQPVKHYFQFVFPDFLVLWPHHRDYERNVLQTNTSFLNGITDLWTLRAL